MRYPLAIAAGLALALTCSLAIGGSSYVPPTASGGGVSGDGTGITDAAAFRSSLDAQQQDPTLDAYSGATCTAGQLLYCSDADVVSATPITTAGRALLDDAAASDQRTTLGLGTAAVEASGAFQAADADLTALAGVTSSVDKLPYFTGAGTASVAGFTAAARDLLDDSTAADMRGTLGVSAPTVEVLTGASGNWSKPAGCSYVTAIAIGDGGSGGSGYVNSVSSSRGGGGGGGGGGYGERTIPCSVLGPTEAYTVGQGAAGGAPQTGNGAGTNGTSGTGTTFGSWVRAAGGGRGMGGQTVTTGSFGAGGYSIFSGVSGGLSGLAPGGNAGTASPMAAGGGGGGGGSASNNAVGVGGDGSAGTLSKSSTGLAGGTGGAAASGGGVASDSGVAGASAATGAPYGGGGGGGGGASASGVTGNGGAGGLYGGGGGGGAAATSPNDSGAGGAGAAGILVVITTF